MLFHAVRSYSIKNLFINGSIVHYKEVNYKVVKNNKSNNIYLMRKYNQKQKKLKIF